MTYLLAEYDEEQAAPEEIIDSGSRKHSYLQARLAYLFSAMERFDVYTELSLDTSNLEDEVLQRHYKRSIDPDVCVYSQEGYDEDAEDDVKMTEMPLLAIEILSPYQGEEILGRKAKAYFALGVQSYWIVYPRARIVTVYTNSTQSRSFSQGDVIDSIADVRLSLNEIFR